MNQTSLKGGRHVKLWLFQRHPKARLSLRPKPAKLEQQKQVLKRKQPAAVPPRRQRQSRALMSVVRHDRLKQTVAVCCGHPQMELRRRPEEPAQFDIQSLDDWRDALVLLKPRIGRA